VLSTDAEGRRLWRTPLGDFWAPAAAGAEFVARITAEMLADVYRYRCGRGAVVLDCGANLGFFTREALRRGAGFVVAFEPSPETAACFRLTFNREIQEGRVRLIDKGLWWRTERLFLRTFSENPASDCIDNTVSGLPGAFIDTTTIDAAFGELGLDRLDFIKVDVEGAELQVLDGATETIKRFHPAIGIGTEHGDDILANNIAVIEKVRSLLPAYRYVCTEAHVLESPSRGRVITPHALHFTVEPAGLNGVLYSGA
jgi:FkbM family methyltransferase